MMFSIIIPVYNAHDFIRNCVQSVADQKYGDYELIIIDDGSTDGSTDHLEDLLSGINYRIIRIENNGVSNARNVGLDNAAGEYVLFLDADDAFPENTLTSYYEIIEAENRPDIVLGGFYRVYPKKTSRFELKGEEVLRSDEEHNDFDPFISRFSGCVWGKCYKREILSNERFDTALSLCEDAEFNLRVFGNAVRFVYINKPLYCYTYSESSTIRKYNADYVKKYVTAVEKIRRQSENKKFEQEYLEFACAVFNVICYNVIFNKLNDRPVKEKCEQVKEIRENTVFDSVLEKIELKRLSLKHRVSIILAIRKHYRLIYFYSVINGIVNRFLY